MSAQIRRGVFRDENSPQFCGFQANLTPEICLNPLILQYLFFSVHFVEENTFISMLEICLQMPTKMSQNASKVVHFIKNFLLA